METTTEVLDNFIACQPKATPDTKENPELWQMFGAEWVRYEPTKDDVSIYELMTHYILDNGAKYVATPKKRPDAIVLVSGGWASPLGDDGEVTMPPSQHPERKRVELVHAISPLDAQQASVMTMFTQAGEVADTLRANGEASGDITVTLDSVALAVWGSAFIHSLMDYFTSKRAELTETQVKTCADRLAHFLRIVGESDESENDTESD
jgi:hypothetical protein